MKNVQLFFTLWTKKQLENNLNNPQFYFYTTLNYPALSVRVVSAKSALIFSFL